MRAPTCTGGRSGSLALTQPDAACRVSDVAWPVTPRPCLTEARNAEQHQVWVEPLQGVDVEPPAVQRPGREILHQHVRPRDQLAGVRASVAPRLPALRYSNKPAALRVGDAAGERTPAAQRVSGGRLDLGDLGTEVDEKLCGVRT